MSATARTEANRLEDADNDPTPARPPETFEQAIERHIANGDRWFIWRGQYWSVDSYGAHNG